MDYNDVLPKVFVFLPTLGQEQTFDIVKITKESNAKLNIKIEETKQALVDDEMVEVKVKKDLGFFLKCELAGELKGKFLCVTSYRGLKMFQENNVQDGDLITVKHPEEGVWKVEKGPGSAPIPEKDAKKSAFKKPGGN